MKATQAVVRCSSRVTKRGSARRRQKARNMCRHTTGDNRGTSGSLEQQRPVSPRGNGPPRFGECGKRLSDLAGERSPRKLRKEIEMQMRKLGNSDLHITRVGYEAWAIGGSGWQFAWGSQDDNEAVAAIHRALELGVNWIDTAAVYGLGHSEEVVGRAL